MERKYQKLLVELEEELSISLLSFEDMLKNARDHVAICSKYIQMVKTLILEKGFVDEHQRIYFLKEINPLFFKHYIMHKEIFQLEYTRPQIQPEAIVEHIEKWLQHISLFFDRNRDLYNYWRMGDSHLDDQLFSQKDDTVLHLGFSENYHPHTNAGFSNEYSYKIGKFLGYKDLAYFLKEYMLYISQKSIGNSIPITSPTPHIGWTDSKSDLIELAYALHANQSINGGKIHIKQIIQLLEKCFQIDLGNFYRVFQGHRIRQKRTAYLDTLKRSLEKKMDESDADEF